MTKRFEYTDVDSKLKEAEAYITSDFVTTATPNRPAITLPSGQFDSSLIPGAATAASLVINRLASEPILIGDLVSATTANHVGLADANTTESEATVVGIATNAADTEENVIILILGVMTNAAFSIFTVNDPLFLDIDGGITNERPVLPTHKYFTPIGKSLGGNDIFITVLPPTVLG